MASIAFIGLGNMGGPMALNLIKAGETLTVFDIVAEAQKPVVEAGAEGASSAANAVKGADIVFTMLPASRHVESLYLGEGALLEHAKQGALLVDCSTIAPETAKKVAAAASERGFTMLDAPVSGGTAGAANATLTFIVGGDKSALEQARSLLEKMGKNIFHAGENGAGQTAKVCNNMLLGISMIGTSEAINLGVANGLDPKVLSDIMNKSSGRNWVLDVYNPCPGVMEGVPASKDYQGGFGSDLMLKDLGLAEEASLKTRCSTPLGSMARSLYELHSKNGSGGLDFASIFKMFKS